MLVSSSLRPSVFPSAEGIVSALYLPQYLAGLFKFFTSSQPTSESAMRDHFFNTIFIFCHIIYFRLLATIWPWPMITHPVTWNCVYLFITKGWGWGWWVGMGGGGAGGVGGWVVDGGWRVGGGGFLNYFIIRLIDGIIYVAVRNEGLTKWYNDGIMICSRLKVGCAIKEPESNTLNEYVPYRES